MSRIEAGRVGRVSFARLRALGVAVGTEIELNVRWRGEGVDRLLDAAHAATVDIVVGLLRRDGWEAHVEATFAVGAERGSVDILARHAESAIVLVCEVKSVVPDIQAMLSSIDRKARLAPALARERGWSATGYARLLCIAEGRTARRRLETHAATFSTAFPVQGRAALAWLGRPTLPAISGVAFVPVAKSSSTRPGNGSQEANAGRQGFRQMPSVGRRREATPVSAISSAAHR